MLIVQSVSCLNFVLDVKENVGQFLFYENNSAYAFNSLKSTVLLLRLHLFQRRPQFFDFGVI